MATIGYQHTEVGVFPSEWEAVTISELGPISKGKGISRSECGTGKIPCVRYGELYTDYDNYVKNFRSYISDVVASTSRKLHYGELLFAGSGETKEEIGKCAAYVNDCEAYAGGDIVIVTPNLEKYDPLFLGFLMNDSYVVRQKALRGQGDAVVHITGKTLGSVQLVVPPTLDEQRKIAKALSDIDGLIDTLSKLIEKKKNIKIGAMQQLLTGEKRLAGFSEAWEEHEIGKVVKIVKGQSLQSKDFINGYVPVVAGGQSYAGYHNVANHTETCITISASGAYAGYVWLHDYPIFASDCSVIEGNEDMNIRFIYYVLKLNQDVIYKAQTGGAQPHIHPRDISPIKLSIPSKDEQAAIATVLTDIDTEIAAIEKKKAKYELLKKGMMQELLTGKVRLV